MEYMYIEIRYSPVTRDNRSESVESDEVLVDTVKKRGKEHGGKQIVS